MRWRPSRRHPAHTHPISEASHRPRVADGRDSAAATVTRRPGRRARTLAWRGRGRVQRGSRQRGSSGPAGGSVGRGDETSGSGRVRLGRRQPVLITSAAEPRQEEIRRRQRRYVFSMLFRTVMFVLAVVAFDGVARFVAIMVALVVPWVAVVVANGGPPRGRTRPSLVTARAADAPPEHALEPGRHPIVEGEVGDPPSSSPSSSPPPPSSPSPPSPPPA